MAIETAASWMRGEIGGTWQRRLSEPCGGRDSSAVDCGLACLACDAGDLATDPDDHGIRPEGIRLGWCYVLPAHPGKRFLAFGRLFAGVC